jgi:hypothetical protein
MAASFRIHADRMSTNLWLTSGYHSMMSRNSNHVAPDDDYFGLTPKRCARNNDYKLDP